MISPDEVRAVSLSLPHVSEAPHHHIISFKVKGKIFATLNLQENRACLKLNAVDQDVFSSIQKDIIFPVPNAWGKYGWTLVSIKKVKKSLFRDALNCAYENVASTISKKKKPK